MSVKEVYDYVMHTPKNTNPAVLSSMLRHLSWNDLQDKPFYVEEKKNLVVEGAPYEGGYYNVQTILVEREEYTYIIDGVECTGKAYYDDTDGMTVTLFNANGDYMGSVVWNYIYVNTEYFVNPSHKIERVEYRKIHKLDAKYLPDPFWVEEKRILVVEGVPEYGNYDVQTTLVEGEEYTYIIDGVEYTGKCFYDEPDRCVYLPDPMDTIAIVYEHGISMRKYEDQDVFHKIERVEKVYHTHHDFMAIINEDDDTGELEVKLVAGDFAATKAKILKGLPATAYVCLTTYSDGWQEIGNYIYELFYRQDNGDEYLVLRNWGLAIRPDNTID